MRHNTGDDDDDQTVDDTTTLYTLIQAYTKTRLSSLSLCQTTRLTDVLTQLELLIAEYDTSFRRAEYPDDPLVVVCFYHAPISRWSDQTYATCLSSLITTFFNPYCVLPSSPLAAQLKHGEDPVVADEDVKQLQLLFGGVLLYIHGENAKLARYMDQLQTYFHAGTKAWRKFKPSTMYARILNAWRTCLDDISHMGQSPDDKPMLCEAIMNRDERLLGQGLKKFSANQDPSQPFPRVMTLALLQYQCSRQTTLTAEMVARTLQLSKAEEEAEAERRKNGEHACDEFAVSLETQIQESFARKEHDEAENQDPEAVSSTTIEAQ